VIETLFSLAFVAQAIRLAVPLAYAAIGGSITERSGMIDLALEAKLLFGAFAAAAVGHATGSGFAGILAGVAAGAAVAGVQAWLVLAYRADQVIVGIGLNIIAYGGTRFLLQLLYHEGANSPPAPSYGDAVLANPLVWGAIVAAAVTSLAVQYTRWGLRLRAAGDRPEALLAVGASPIHARIAAALVAGALAGAGGAHLSLSVGVFSADMSNGRGYTALVMVILAGWRPGLAALACLAMGFFDALQVQLALAGTALPSELLGLTPYILTLTVLLVFGERRPPPRALGKS